MHKVDITFECIAQTRINPEAMRRWLDRVGAVETPVPKTQPYGLCEKCGGSGIEDWDTDATCSDCFDHPGKLSREVTDAGALCGLCAKRCYMSFEPGLNPNVTRVRKDWYDYLTNILNSHHGSTTEHASWTFAIEGVSRVFTGELNRHRAGVGISEGSMRYIRFDDIGFWMPNSLSKDDMSLMPTRKCKACKGKGNSFGEESDDPDSWIQCTGCDGSGRINLLDAKEFEHKKEVTRLVFHSGFKEMQDNYKELCRLWGIETMKAFDTKKKLTSMFRRLIGMGVATGGTWTFNTRALRHILAMRTSPHAEEEIAYVFSMIGKWIVDSEPALFGDFEQVNGCWVPRNVKI